MQLHHLLMIAGSAFMHASYSVLLKTRGKDPYLLPGFFFVATLVAWGDVWRHDGLGVFATGDLPMIYLAALFYVMYQMFCAKAYQMGDISALYPLTVLGPVLIPIWAWLFLSEHIGVLASVGIALTFVGAACIKLKTLSWDEVKKALGWHGDYAGARWALAASFVYSIGAIFDKASVGRFEGSSYLAFILSFMTLNMLVALIFSKQRPLVKGANLLPMILGGLALYWSFMLFRVALKEVFVSIATPIRQMSIIFAMGFGFILLKEKIQHTTLLGAVSIICGVCLLALTKH